ncbi:hypothetical protein BH11BAC2_BH11BAC2_13240 [soil metagenome]
MESVTILRHFHPLPSSIDQKLSSKGAICTDLCSVTKTKAMLTISIIIITSGIGVICWQQYVEMKTNQSKS